MRKTRWANLDPRVRRGLMIAAAAEGALKVAALIDLARRPSSEIRGSKPRWALAIIAVNSGGAVPISYFLRGRR